MADKTNSQLDTELQQLKNVVQGLSNMISELTQNVNSRPQRSDLVRSEMALDVKIKSNAELISKLEQKLEKINLPTDTRYYLDTSEISDFRSNFNKLLAMMASFDTLYKNLVAYNANNSSSS